MKTIRRRPMTDSQRAESRAIPRSMNDMIGALVKNRIARFPALATKDGEIATYAFCRKQYPTKFDAHVACTNFGV